MYPDTLPAATRLAAAPTAAEMNARVSALVAARQAAVALAQEATRGGDGGGDGGSGGGGGDAGGGGNKWLACGEQPLQMVQLPAPGDDKSDFANIEEGTAAARPKGSECEPGGRIWLIRNLLCLGTSFMVMYIAMKGAINLQSSVFAEVGLGAAGLTSYYAGFLFSNLFLPTLIIKWLGCKMTVVVTILSYGPYIIAQLWARFYTLVPGGLLAGLAAGPMWVAQGTYLSHLARVHTARRGAAAEPEDVLMVRLFGTFYMLYQMSQVWGNLVSSAVLSRGASARLELNGTREICGANFCAASSQSASQLAQGRPDDSQLATITFAYIGCVIAAALIVLFGVDPIPRSEGKPRRNSTATNGNDANITRDDNLSYQSEKLEDELSKSTAVVLSNGTLLVSNGNKTYGGTNGFTNGIGNGLSDSLTNSISNGLNSSISNGLSISHSVSNGIAKYGTDGISNGIAKYDSDGISNGVVSNGVSNGIVSNGSVGNGTVSNGTAAHGGHTMGYNNESVLGVVCATVKLTAHTDLLLLVPITAFLGVEDTFLAADYTASYVSCAWGISNIGYVMICYGILNSAAALLGGWVVKLTGRLPVVLAGAVLQTAVVAALRVWQPHPSDTTLFFTMAGLWGVTDGIWQAQINAMYGILFPGQEEAAYSSFRLWEGVGYIMAYSYSSHLCTDMKLYTLLALMLAGVTGYVIDEIRLRRRSKNVPS